MLPAAHDPDRTALVFAAADTAAGDRIGYGELDAAANRFHHLLRDWGVACGDHVALCMENAAELFAVVWGARYAGTLYTAISTRLGTEELAYVVRDCGARVLVLGAAQAERAAAVKAATPTVERHVLVGAEADGWDSYAALVAAQPPTPVPETRIAGHDMLYSSGTTGRPKGIEPTDVAPLLEEAPLVVTPLLSGVFGVGPDDVYLSPAPLYHAAPLRYCLAMHQLGATVVVMERFDAAQYLALVAEHRVTVSQLVPAMFVRLLRLERSGGERAARDRAAVHAATDLTSLRLVIHAAAPCPPDVKRAMLDWWGPIIHEYYASTEACGLTWIRPEEWLERPGSVGRGMVGVPRIVGDDGREVAAGETGAVYFSGGPRFRYHDDPAKTAAATNAEGWQTFGDVGHVDAHGFLYLTDRAAYMIIVNGVNVYPQEAEDVLQSHPEVLDAAVFGVPDPETGERVHAVVQPVAAPAGPAAAAALEQELLAHLHARLAAFKCPRAIDFRAALPRHETGKLYKRLLKDEYAARAAR